MPAAVTERVRTVPSRLFASASEEEEEEWREDPGACAGGSEADEAHKHHEHRTEDVTEHESPEPARRVERRLAALCRVAVDLREELALCAVPVGADESEERDDQTQPGGGTERALGRASSERE